MGQHCFVKHLSYTHTIYIHLYLYAHTCIYVRLGLNIICISYCGVTKKVAFKQKALFMSECIQCWQPICEVGSLVTPILQLRKLRFREVKFLQTVKEELGFDPRSMS